VAINRRNGLEGSTATTGSDPRSNQQRVIEMKNVFLVYYEEEDFAGLTGRTVWDNVYDSKEKALARIEELSKEEGVEDADYERFEVK